MRRRLALDIVRKLQDEAVREHELRQLFWECTLRCNLACRHCGSDCRVQSSVKDMPVEDFCLALDSVAREYDSHKVMVNITGGEPLVRKDLEACGRVIYERGFPWGMVTNGLALTPERYASLLASGLRSMTISLDGLGEVHDWMRGRPGTFKKASEAIKMVIDSGEIEFDVVTCVNKRSLPQLPALKEYIQGNIDFVMEFFAQNDLGIRPIRPEASFLVWLDCSGLGLDHERLVDLFINKAHLALNDGEMFGLGGEGFMRLNTGTPRAILAKALEQLKEAVCTLH